MLKIKGMGGLAIALAASLAVAGVGADVAHAQGKDKKAAKGGGGFSPAFTAAAAPLQAKIQAAQAAKAKADAGDAAAKAQYDAALAGAPAMLAAAEAAATTPADKATAGQFAINLGGFVSDVSMRQRGAKALIDSGLLPPDKLPEMQFFLGNFAYANKDYATAQTALSAAVGGGYQADEAVELLADSYTRGGNPQAGLAALHKAIDARRAAGQPVPAAWVRRGNLIAYNAKIAPEAIDFAILQAQTEPSNVNWLNAAQNVRNFARYAPAETIDLYRLMMRSGALNNDPRYVTPEYKEYIEAASKAGIYGDVVKAIDQGTSSGALNGSMSWVGEARSAANNRLAADKASVASQEREARAAANGISALGVAYLYLSFGEPAKAEELFKLALQKGVADKDRAQMRLGIAQFDQGKYAEARDSFSKVAGQRQSLARLWLALVAQKGGARAG